MIENIVIVLILLAITGAVIFYLYRQKKKGVACVGCPYAKQCGSGKCSCHSAEKNP